MKVKKIKFSCPVCKKGYLKFNSKKLLCINKKCQLEFPLIKGIPILINEKSSIFSIDDFTNKRETTIKFKKDKFIIKILKKFIPKIKSNLSNKDNFLFLSKLLLKRSQKNKVLVIGSGIEGKGLDILRSIKGMNIISSDVSISSGTNVICDAHDLPFQNESFDAVISQAVLEHVANPYVCVSEIYRVLKSDGFVYAETPFMQQVHMAPYDFTRFTYIGHRRLFRKFKEIKSGIACGPGMALAWSYQNFLLSFFESKILRKIIRVFTSFTSFYLSYFDKYLISKSVALDAASAYYFLGQKSKIIITDKELINKYKRYLG